jgi:hypothetical protein
LAVEMRTAQTALAELETMRSELQTAREKISDLETQLAANSQVVEQAVADRKDLVAAEAWVTKFEVSLAHLEIEATALRASSDQDNGAVDQAQK